jgi:hypothetical protein
MQRNEAEMRTNQHSCKRYTVNVYFLKITSKNPHLLTEEVCVTHMAVDVKFLTHKQARMNQQLSLPCQSSFP